MSGGIYLLAGAQTDFARKWVSEGLGISDMLREVSEEVLAGAQVPASAIESVHVGNFVSERFCGQGHLGGLVAEVCPGLAGVASTRHEAACASGGVAMMAAMAALESGRAGTALVVGAELMRNMPTREAAKLLDAAAWVPHETEDVAFIWPHVFAEVGALYRQRYGLRREHLVALARSNFRNARHNPLAQTRAWQLDDSNFSQDPAHNPEVVPGLRRHDCSQVTDGAAAVVLARGDVAKAWADSRGLSLASVPQILGWGHRTDRLSFSSKQARAREGTGHLFEHVRGAVTDAMGRAGVSDVRAQIAAVETHDCFSTTHYMAIDHLGLTPVGENYRAIEDGTVFMGGDVPINPSGGLIGGGHPVGATGVRMAVDAWRQVTGVAGGYQVPRAHGGRVATLNLGGSATTSVCMVIGCDT